MIDSGCARFGACALAVALAACSDRPLDLSSGVATRDLGGVTPSAPTLDELAHVCALAASCDAARDLGNFISASDCTSTLIDSWPEDPVSARLVSCSGAQDCASLFSCFGGDLLLVGRFAVSAQCDGSAVVRAGLRFDCAALGLTCVKEAPLGDRAACASSACDVTQPNPCDGTVVDYCNSGIRVPADCAELGGTCAGGQCVGTGASCDATTASPSCAGGVASSCLNGQLASRDCARQALPTDCVMGQCLYDSSAIQCLIGNTMCNGNSLVLCAGAAGGEWKTVDCTALGFSGCALAQGTDQALCQ